MRASHLKGALSGLRQFLSFESALKMVKNTFYFILKTRFVLNISKFLSLIFGHVEKQLIFQKLILKFMTSQPGKHILTISQEAKAIRQWNLIT